MKKITKLAFPDSVNWRLEIVRPGGKRRTFGVRKYWREDGRKKYETVKSETIDSINDQYLNEKLTERQTVVELQRYIQSQYQKAGAVLSVDSANSDNQEVLEAFWKAKYKRSKISDKESAMRAYLRVLRAMGPVSLRAASDDDIQEAIDGYAEKNARGDRIKYAKSQRRLVKDTNVLLKHLKRTDVYLFREEEPQEEVAGLTADEVHHMVKFIDNEVIRLACLMAFYTGCRPGELIALDDMSYQPGAITVHVKHSINRKNIKGKTKTGAPRTAYLFPEGRKLYREWVRTIPEFMPYFATVSRYVGKACRKAWPDNPEKWITFYDLRHSYAKRMASEGASTTEISTNMGNSEYICKKFYIGWMMDEDQAKRLDMRLEEGRNMLQEEGEDV